MKKTLCLIVAICLVVSLLCGALCACNNKSDNKQKERDSALENVHRAFICGVSQDWQVGMSDEQIAQLDNAGDYVVTDGWTQLVCGVLGKSSIQTAKIGALATALSSQDGKDVLGDFENNGTKLIGLLKGIGFTTNDVSNLVIDMLKALVNDSTRAVNDMVDKLNRVKEYARGNQVAFDNVNSSLAVVNVAKSNFLLTTSEKEAMLTALDNAKNAINSLIDFAYNMSMNDMFDDLLETLVVENGALSDISTSEISTFVGTIMQNVNDLKNALTASEIAKLNTALNLVIEKFDVNTISSALYAQIIKYAKYAYMVVDVLPTVCDVVNACGGVVGNEVFIEKVKTYALSNETLNENANNMNATIIIANVVESLMQNFDSQSWNDVINQLGAHGQDEYQKAVPILAMDLVLNAANMLDVVENKDFILVHPDIISQDDFFKGVSFVLFFNGGLDKFVEGYNRYLAGEIDIYQLQALAELCSFDSFGVVNMFSPITQTEAWFNYYMVNGVQAVKSFVCGVIPSVVEDMKAFVDDYYAQNSPSHAAVEQLANMPLFMQDLSDEEVETYYPLIKKSCLFVFFVVAGL